MSTITATNEQQVLEQVPKQLYIAGEWRDGSKGTLPVEDPSTGETLVEVADASPDDAKAALDAAADGRPGVGQPPAPRARRDPPARVRRDHGSRRRARAVDDARDGQAAEGVQGGDRVRRRVPALVLRGGGADRRPLRGGPERPGAPADDAAAGRAVPADHAVELPARDGNTKDWSRDRGWMHDGRQARPADAAVDAGAGQDPRGGRPARRRAQPDHRLEREREHRAR